MRLIKEYPDTDRSGSAPGVQRNEDKKSLPNIGEAHESFRKYCERFQIDSKVEEQVCSINTPKGWKDMACSPDDFEGKVKQELGRGGAQPYDIYISSGTFNIGSIRSENGRTLGRRAENLKRVLRIPLDADYIDYEINK